MELVCPLPCATATIANQVQSDLTLIQSLIANYKSATAAEQPGIVQKISAALGGAGRRPRQQSGEGSLGARTEKTIQRHLRRQRLPAS